MGSFSYTSSIVLLEDKKNEANKKSTVEDFSAVQHARIPYMFKYKFRN